MTAARTLLIALTLAALSMSPTVTAAAPQTQDGKPNVVILYADDLGYGDVHCYNPDRGRIPTPCLDRLAAEGMRCTDAHSSSGVCSPSRYTLLTGRYHWRSRLQSGIVTPWGKPLIAADRLTLGTLAKQHGYVTACIGKWHLGWDWPIPPDRLALFTDKKPTDAATEEQQQALWATVFAQPIAAGPTTRGFDLYFGTDVPNWPPFCFIEGDRTIGIPTSRLKDGPGLEGWTFEPVLPTLADRACSFIENQARQGDPFLLYMPLTSPHTPIAPNPEWRGKSDLNAYADFVMETDAVVGRVMEALERGGVAGRTLVVFTSDNGCSPAAEIDALERQGHFPSGPLRGHKADAWEGGHRVPFIVRWPGVVAAGATCAALVHQADLLRTFADILGAPLPENAGEDSVSLLPLFRGDTRPVREHAVSASIQGVPAIRSGAWKYIPAPGSGGWSKGGDPAQPVQLYDLSRDVGETNNLASAQPDKLAAMAAVLEQLIVAGRSTPGAPQQNDVEVVRYPHAAQAKPAARKFPARESDTRLRAEGRLNFNRDVRPILSDRCFSCHGPDHEDRQGGLRLDLRDGAIAALDSGATAVVPGDPAKSEIIVRITSTDPDVVMPPPRLNKPITPAEGEILKRWISEGAEYRGHWAFEQVDRPAVPDVKNAAWGKTPIDRFILERLEQEGLAPNPEADRATLARRLALDITGLPPVPGAVDAFLADGSPDAYEKYVDTLLASPHYGERMAIEWLDASRYADSSGYQTDSSWQNWPWRDWLINAYNRNLPFDQFTIHQLAGDMLENPTRDQIVATGFNRNHRLNGEAGIIAEEWRVETVIDRVETTAQTWMALSAGCARCHDHKYDPLSQKEFYSLFALFNNVPETGINSGNAHSGGGNVDPVQLLPSPEQETELARLEKVATDAGAALRSEETNVDALVAKWEESIRPALSASQEAWEPFEPLELRSVGGASFRRSEDGSWYVEGKSPPKDTYEFETLVPSQILGGLRLEVLPDPSLAGGGGFGRSGNGNIVVTRIEAEIEPPGDAKVIPVELVRAEASYEQSGWPAPSVLQLKGEKGTGWAIDGNDPEKRAPRRIAVFPVRPVTLPENSRLVVRIRQEAFDGHTIGRFRVAFSADDPALVGVEGSALPGPVKEAIAVDAAVRSPQQKAEIANFYRTNVDGPIRRAEAARDAARKSVESFRDSLLSAMVMKEGTVREAFVLIRGEYAKRGEQVTAGLPAFLPKLPEGAKPDRLALAKWLVSRDHPLTARVWVNRMWERLFGTGLSKTSENLGSQAEFPSHPELLDWLAAEFMETGWDMKRFVKLVVTSATYRQNAIVTPEKLAKDPVNRLLARAPRIRLPAESVRDAAFAAAGLLVPAIGGPSVRPWMPDGVWDETSKYGDLRGYKPDTGAGRYRRTMYTVWKRTAAPPTMLLFDAPNRETCIVKRSRTNTPLQALALLNETTFVESAHGLAKRMVAEGGTTPAERIAHGFRLAIGRKPTADELAALVDGFSADLATFAAAPERAEKYATVGLVKKPDDMSPNEFAAYSLAANVMINLDEFVMRE